MSAEQPTARQQQILDYLRRNPGSSYREIGARFGIRSPNGVLVHLKALERKGYLTRSNGKSRSIRLADDPQDALLHAVDQVLRECNPDSPTARWALRNLAEKRKAVKQ